MSIAPSTHRPDEKEQKHQSVIERLFPSYGGIASRSLFSVVLIYVCYILVRSLRDQPADFLPAIVGALGSGLLLFLFLWIYYRLLVLAGGSEVARSLTLLTVPALVTAIFLSYFVDLAQKNVAADVPGLNMLDGIFVHYLLIAGWGGLYLALVQSQKHRQLVAQSHNLERLTRQSEQRALRFQLNPHFVFNALNSVSSLVVNKQNSEAEELVDNLADYMRSVLADDGKNIISLDNEIAQQLRYLEIEKVRFPDRLIIATDIDESVTNWKIPALIIQPLVENAIKHGVAKSTKSVRVKISAALENGRLKIDVANDGHLEVASEDGSGTGTGLANISERLLAVYGPSAALVTANRRDGMVVSSVIIPDESHIFRNG